MEVSHVSLPSELHSWGVISVPALSVHFLGPDLKSPWLETFHYNFVLEMNITTPPPKSVHLQREAGLGREQVGPSCPVPFGQPFCPQSCALGFLFSVRRKAREHTET